MSFIPAQPEYFDDGINGMAPVMWYGPDARDGDHHTWASAGVGSLYFQRDQVNSTVVLWLKVANNGADADWEVLTSYENSISDMGDVTVTTPADGDILVYATDEFVNVAPTLVKIQETVAFDAFTDNLDATGEVVLTATLPAGAIVYRAVLKDVTGFTGDTSAVLTVGDGTDVDRYGSATPVNVFVTAAVLDCGVPSGLVVQLEEESIVLTVTSATDFTGVVAGALTISLYYIL